MPLGSSLATAVTALAIALGSAAGTVADGSTHSGATTSSTGAVGSLTSGETTTSGWTWPLSPQPQVLNPFDPPRERWLPGHRGVDLAAGSGQEVLAPTDGRVVYSGALAGRGVVVVAHAGGLRSTLEPVVSGAPVGTLVSRGEPVGHLGASPTHCRPLVCLHWGVLRGRTYLDPLGFIGPAPIVLLPLR